MVISEFSLRGYSETRGLVIAGERLQRFLDRVSYKSVAVTIDRRTNTNGVVNM
jgi:hypothetical protein